MKTYLFSSVYFWVVFPLVPPEVMVKDEVLYADMGQSVTFGCIIMGEPIVDAYWTKKDGSKIGSNWKYEVRQVANYGLTLTKTNYVRQVANYGLTLTKTNYVRQVTTYGLTLTKTNYVRTYKSTGGWCKLVKTL